MDAVSVRLVVDDRCAVAHCGFGVEHVGQDLVLHLDQTQGLLRQFRRLGGHHRHPVAHVAHLVIQHDLVVRGRLRESSVRRRRT
jgi:hypothetical protein